jgi:hypothetical protein
MKLYYEWGTKQLLKKDEELCGDNVAIARRADSLSLALSDGLGSGVKANILSTLTTRIVMHLIENDIGLSEVVETLSKTLPVCDVRKLAYSTFAIGQFFSQGNARIVEFDTPPTMLLRGRKSLAIPFEQRQIEDKRIQEKQLELKLGDWVVLVSDGVINAGIGGRYPLGWGHDQVSHFLEEHCHPNLSAQELANKLGQAVSDLYCDTPGDDVSIVVIKVRSRLVATVLTGPPVNRAKDREVIERFKQHHGHLIVCGGTTANIVARETRVRPPQVNLDTMTEDVPPIARLENIDLTTEGVLTLTKADELLKSGVTKENIQFGTDGTSELIRLLLEVDSIHFIVGQTVNPAHQNPDLPRLPGMKLATVRSIAEQLTERGKEVTIETV